jgi:hypothetical protein
MDGVTGKREETLASIPKALQEHINTAYPAHVCLVGTTLAQWLCADYSARQHHGLRRSFRALGAWQGINHANLADGTKVTIFLRKPPLREAGLLPRGGIARFYGTAKI